eukprot:666424-Pyramimonas_sp.AAC.1
MSDCQGAAITSSRGAEAFLPSFPSCPNPSPPPLPRPTAVRWRESRLTTLQGARCCSPGRPRPRCSGPSP